MKDIQIMDQTLYNYNNTGMIRTTRYIHIDTFKIEKECVDNAIVYIIFHMKRQLWYKKLNKLTQ